ncbi:hypothetical protein LGM65_32490, partial [Burkholderia anthina]|uniref:hypothetical protein n=1 Tax=Burkholderia anthina TaxID=179879 RepID=UPI001CF1D056
LARPVSRVVFNRQSATDASTEWVKVNTDGHGLQPHLWVILSPRDEVSNPTTSTAKVNVSRDGESDSKRLNDF